MVIPLYNEATVVGGVIDGLRSTFPKVVAVDDGSTDDSVAIARKAGAVVVQHPINLGQGAALQTGIEFALRRGAEYLVTFDADGQHRVVDAAAMVTAAKQDDLAFVLGSRFLDRRTRPGVLKKIVLKLAVWHVRASTRLKVTDAHNGLRVLRADAARSVEIQQDRMAHASEIVAQLGRTGLPWREFPVQIEYTTYSKAKGQSLWNTVNILTDLAAK